jgi:hypothetical protein
MPVGIRFSRPIPDLPAFCEELFSSRAPFRLWGQPFVTDDGASVEAVDLHVGQRLSMELGYDWMRVYLHAGSCGNTVARLISNLQTRFDGALSLTHPGLQDAVALEPSDTLRHQVATPCAVRQAASDGWRAVQGGKPRLTPS